MIHYFQFNNPWKKTKNWMDDIKSPPKSDKFCPLFIEIANCVTNSQNKINLKTDPRLKVALNGYLREDNVSVKGIE